MQESKAKEPADSFMYAGTHVNEKRKNIYLPSLPLSLSISPPSLGDQVTALAPLPAPGYELRSQGPPALGVDALDK